MINKIKIYKTLLECAVALTVIVPVISAIITFQSTYSIKPIHDESRETNENHKKKHSAFEKVLLSSIAAFGVLLSSMTIMGIFIYGTAQHLLDNEIEKQLTRYKIKKREEFIGFCNANLTNMRKLIEQYNTNKILENTPKQLLNKNIKELLSYIIILNLVKLDYKTMLNLDNQINRSNSTSIKIIEDLKDIFDTNLKLDKESIDGTSNSFLAPMEIEKIHEILEIVKSNPNLGKYLLECNVETFIEKLIKLTNNGHCNIKKISQSFISRLIPNVDLYEYYKNNFIIEYLVEALDQIQLNKVETEIIYTQHIKSLLIKKLMPLIKKMETEIRNSVI